MTQLLDLLSKSGQIIKLAILGPLNKANPCYKKLNQYLSKQTKFNYYTELHVSTYLRSSSGSQLVFKTHWVRNIDYVSP
jgi:hypothetical protein